MSKKSESTLRTKFSSLFGSGQRSTINTRSSPEEFNLDSNTLNELSKGNPQNRLKLLKHLVEKVEEKRLEKNAIKSLWIAVQDIAKEGPTDARHTVIGFLSALVSSHFNQLESSMRQTLFQYIESCHPDDIEPCFSLLVSLTLNGSNLHLLEEQIGIYIEKILPQMIKRKKLVDLLKFLSEMTKTNATYVDTSLLCSVFEGCYYPTTIQPIEEIQECLNYIGVVVRYAIIPPDCISMMMRYVCCVRCVIPKEIAPGSSEAHPVSANLKNLMKMLVSIQSLEHTIIFTMCSFLEKAPPESFVNSSEIQISTMYLLSTTLWSKSRPSPKQHHCSAVLASVSRAVGYRHEGVLVEVLESFKFYIANHGAVIEHLTLDAMLGVVQLIVLQQREMKFSNKEILGILNGLLTDIEQMYTSSQDFSRCKDRFYEVIELCIDVRPIESISRLMDMKERHIIPGTPHWSKNLQIFMSNFYSTTRPERIRRHALERCWAVVEQFYGLYEDELLEDVVLKVLPSVHTDPNASVRHRAVLFLLELSYRCCSDKFYHILNIILKIISVVVQENDESESILICENFTNLFLYKISRTPSRHALFMFNGLIRLATGFYSKKFTPHFNNTAKIRLKVLGCLWRISMTKTGETLVYMPQEGPVRRAVPCPFIRIYVADSCLRPQDVSALNLEVEVPTEPTEPYECVDLPYNQVDHLIYHVLDKEKDWEVVALTLTAIKKRLCNSQFQTPGNLDSLTVQLVDLLFNTKRLEGFKEASKDVSVSDMKVRMFPVIVRLIPHQALRLKTTRDSEMCRKILKALISGLSLKFGKICIEGLILAAVEMPHLIKPRILSHIIHEIAKIAVGRHLAVATLSFLSTVGFSPELYKDFTENEYKMVISVILPYTDPVKFDVPVIHFAHVVVCNWYVRCHYKHRPAFKDYILSQLRSTVRSVDRGSRGSSLNEHHKDKRGSAESRPVLRPRSGEYGGARGSNTARPGERASTGSNTARGSERASTGSNTPRGSFKRNSSCDSLTKLPDTDRLVAHNQLIDVTEDLLQRWMYSGRCNIIKKSSQQELLFSSKKTTTWIVGTTLITISTVLSCDRTPAAACGRCKMVQALVGEGSLGSSDESTDCGDTSFKIPIPGSSSAIHLNKIMTPKCNCWCKDFAHLEIRSPTSNCSVILRLQNKCHFVGLDGAVGGDSHIITSLFDDDLSQLLVRDVRSDYTPQQLENLLSSNASSGSMKYNMTKPRRRRLSTPHADEMTPTPAIEVRQRSHSDLGVTEKCDPLKGPPVDSSLESETRTSSVEICERFCDKEAAHTITQSGVDEALCNPALRRKSSVFKYAKNSSQVNGDQDSGKIPARDSKSSSFYSSPMTSRSSSTHELGSHSSSSLMDCSKVSVDCDQSHNDIDPSFIFRQLYPNISNSPDNMPVILPDSEDISRALRNLDLILVCNTHKIGLVYVGPGQTNEVKILRNTYGSVRYVEFVKCLGDLIWLANCDQKTVYVGGLDTNGLDGDYTVSWRDKACQVVFHVATHMPQHDTDPTSTNKKRHIGNNFVTIVYNDSGLPYQQGTIKGQCNICDIVIVPQPNNMNLVSLNSIVKTKLTDLKPHSALLVSDGPLGCVVRQMAVNANGLCQVMRGPGARNAYCCNWLERLKMINRMTSRSVTPLSSPTPARRDTLC